MTTIFALNPILFGALGLIWRTSDLFNFILKLVLGSMFVVNGFQLAKALGYLVKV